jgi:hypothetical protein
MLPSSSGFLLFSCRALAPQVVSADRDAVVGAQGSGDVGGEGAEGDDLQVAGLAVPETTAGGRELQPQRHPGRAGTGRERPRVVVEDAVEGDADRVHRMYLLDAGRDGGPPWWRPGMRFRSRRCA